MVPQKSSPGDNNGLAVMDHHPVVAEPFSAAGASCSQSNYPITSKATPPRIQFIYWRYMRVGTITESMKDVFNEACVVTAHLVSGQTLPCGSCSHRNRDCSSKGCRTSRYWQPPCDIYAILKGTGKKGESKTRKCCKINNLWPFYINMTARTFKKKKTFENSNRAAIRLALNT